MTLKNQVLFTLLAIVGAFAFGRYSNRQAPTKTAEVVTDTQKNRETHSTTTTVTEKAPDGKVKTTTTTDTTTATQITKKEDNKVSSIPSKTKILNVSALVTLKDRMPVYGLSVSKEVIGPITVGAFGLTSGIVGLSIGINF